MLKKEGASEWALRKTDVWGERETHKGYTGGGETGGRGVRLGQGHRGESAAVPQPRGTRKAIDAIRPKKQPLKEQGNRWGSADKRFFALVELEARFQVNGGVSGR